ncbi:MAG: acyltransferase [Synechococcaceae cyanobacterium RL_1_2]|nr:acyltransferase [Synechococcaceae cyanobacterium RL_1_2]
MLYSVQYMRAIAALLVVIGHAAWKGEQYSYDPLFWFQIGGSGVDLFFIISGYIMCYTVDKKKINLFNFIKARIVRIMPLYWILTSLALIAFYCLLSG